MGKAARGQRSAVIAACSLAAGVALYAFEESWRTSMAWQFPVVASAGLLSAGLLLVVTHTWSRVLILLAAAVSPVAVPALWVSLFVRGGRPGRARLIWTVSAAWAAGAVQTALYSTRIGGLSIGGVTARQFLFLGLSFTGAAMLGAVLAELRARQHRIDELVTGVDLRQRQAVADVRRGERLQLGRDLHDTLGADATVLNLYSRALLGDGALTAQERRLAVEHLAEAAQAVSGELRHIIGRLVAGDETTTEIVDVPTMLSTFRDAFAHIGSSLYVDWPALPPTVDAAVERVCGVFVREALTNALKYAAPGEVKVQVAASDEGALTGCVTSPLPTYVADDVRRRLESSRVGLRSMTARAEDVGGTVQAGPVGGVYVITLTIPSREAMR